MRLTGGGSVTVSRSVLADNQVVTYGGGIASKEIDLIAGVCDNPLTVNVDATGDLRVNATDLGGLRSLEGTPVNTGNPTHVRSDVCNTGACIITGCSAGMIDTCDTNAVRANVGHDARFIPDP